MGDFEIRSNTVTNRLYIKLNGFFREIDIAPTIDALTAETEKLTKDFDIVMDISKFMPGSPKAAEALREGGKLVKERGRRRAVRVTGGLVTGLMQFKRLLGGVFDEDETVRYASSTDEADKILDDW